MANCLKCEKLKDCPWSSDPEVICSAYQQKPITNADRIRAMTDEELADLIAEYIECDMCKFEDEECLADCELRWRKWLREEVKDGDSG